MINRLKKMNIVGVTILSILILLVIAVVISTVTYAFWHKDYQQQEANTFKSGCFSFAMTENTASINLPKTYPMTEQDAMNSISPYTFTITNTCSIDMYYNVTLNTSNNSDLDNHINFKLVDEMNNVTGPASVGSQPEYTDYNNYTYVDENGTYDIVNSYILTTGKLGSAVMNSDNTQVITAGGTKQYSLYLWVDENVEGESTMAKTFTAKVIVTGTSKASTALYKCKKATRLHNAVCSSNEGCSATMNIGDTITYGSIGTSGLSAGNAFDCDVNNDGRFDSENERFYYVTDLSGNTNYAVLVSANTTETIAYDASGLNINGPVSAVSKLSATSEWNNVSLSNTTRNILDENGSIIKADYSYEGYAARFLTQQEVSAACLGASVSDGSLDSCTWLLENTKYQDSTKPDGYWLESSTQTAGKAWSVNSNVRNINLSDTNSNVNGVKPAIEVLKTNITY